ncbi:hypothetical protein CHRYSEOSP005_31240 [Chryseobacterium sp. Alg-005]|uniref:hypothetical protein n=1 Tax=Chryseobacterium sp. Alg-005 TaxID=3159516 RepID=UPI003555928D
MVKKPIKEIRIITEDPYYKIGKKDIGYINFQDLKAYFTQKDIISLKNQYKAAEGFLLTPKYIFNLRIIHENELLSYKAEGKYFWEEFNKKHGNVSFMFVGKPLFSLDKKRVIISYGYYCGGLCGRGEKVILKKVKENWVVEKVLSGFVS